MILSTWGGLVSVSLSIGVLAATPSEVVPWVFGCLVLIFPVAGYCMFLAMINGRQRPTLVSGPWDFAGVLFALSGFLLIGGPAVLLGFQSRWRTSLAQGQLPNLRSLGAANWSFWALVWGAYFAVVLAVALVVMWRRRRVTAIYNIEAGFLHDLLPHVLAQLKLEGYRTANRIFITHADPAALAEASEAIQAKQGGTSTVRLPVDGRPTPQLGPDAAAQTWLELDPFPAMQHVTLRWSGDGAIRRDVEAELARHLAEVVPPDNPAAGWLLTIATCLFGALLLGLVAFVVMLLQTRR